VQNGAALIIYVGGRVSPLSMTRGRLQDYRRV
jgi:hypothetical protein